ncbi:hypothetical protein ACKWTF_012879 [Chironomus riparius]
MTQDEEEELLYEQDVELRRIRKKNQFKMTNLTKVKCHIEVVYFYLFEFYGNYFCYFLRTYFILAIIIAVLYSHEMNEKSCKISHFLNLPDGKKNFISFYECCFMMSSFTAYSQFHWVCSHLSS